MKFKNITIIGLGLMGGSLAAACRKSFPKSRVTGVSRDAGARRLALKRRWAHEATSDLAGGIYNADLIVLCTPVNTFKTIIPKIDRSAKPGTLVTDVGSVKGEIQNWAEKQRFKNIHFVGAHPLVGSHDRGMAAARPDLYEKGFTFVVSGKKNSEALKKVKKFWQGMTPKVFVVSAEAHDKITAEISHLPHLLAFCLSRTPDSKSLGFVGTGFLDTTRIAQGHPSVWVPIFLSNRRAVLRALKKFEFELKIFRKALQNKGFELEKFLLQASRRRRQISL